MHIWLIIYMKIGVRSLNKNYVPVRFQNHAMPINTERIKTQGLGLDVKEYKHRVQD